MVQENSRQVVMSPHRRRRPRPQSANEPVGGPEPILCEEMAYNAQHSKDFYRPRSELALDVTAMDRLQRIEDLPPQEPDPYFDATKFETMITELKYANGSVDPEQMMYAHAKQDPNTPPCPPHFDIRLKPFRLMEGSEASFIAKLRGNPTPDVQWFHNGRQLAEGNRYAIRLTREGFCTLSLRVAFAEDLGVYTVCATNLLGVDVSSAELYMDDGSGMEDCYMSEPEVEKKPYSCPPSVPPPTCFSAPGTPQGHRDQVSEKYKQPVFKVVPLDQTHQEGDVCRFDCMVNGRPPPELSWYHEGTQIYDCPERHIVVKEDGAHSLIVNKTTHADAGLYTCVAHNRGGESCFQVRLSVVGKEEQIRPEFLERLSDIECRLGETITLTAEATGNPPPMMSWTKNGRIVEDDPAGRYVINNQGCFTLLQIKGVELDDATWFQCNAINRVGQAATRARILITGVCKTPLGGQNLKNAVNARRRKMETPQTPAYGKPVVKPAIKPAGTDMQYASDAGNGSDPNKVWPNPPHYENERTAGKPILEPGFFAPGMYNYALGGTPDSDAYDLILKRNLAQACHPEASPDDMAAAGHVAADLVPTLTPEDVFDPENPITPHFRTAPTSLHDVTEGKPALFRCVLVPVGDPSLKVEWYKDGKILTSGHRFVPEYDHNGTCTLTIRYCFPEDSGAYQCVATNCVGVDEVETYLTCSGVDAIQKWSQLPEGMDTMREVALVEEYSRKNAQPTVFIEPIPDDLPPSLAMLPEPLTVEEGDTACFRIKVQGHPPPRVTWWQRGEMIINSSRFKVGWDGMLHWLEVRNCRDYDSGDFVAVAKNPHGEEKADMNLSVIPKLWDWRRRLKQAPASASEVEFTTRRYEDEKSAELCHRFKRAKYPQVQTDRQDDQKLGGMARSTEIMAARAGMNHETRRRFPGEPWVPAQNKVNQETARNIHVLQVNVCDYRAGSPKRIPSESTSPATSPALAPPQRLVQPYHDLRESTPEVCSIPNRPVLKDRQLVIRDRMSSSVSPAPERGIPPPANRRRIPRDQSTPQNSSVRRVNQIQFYLQTTTRTESRSSQSSTDMGTHRDDNASDAGSEMSTLSQKASSCDIYDAQSTDMKNLKNKFESTRAQLGPQKISTKSLNQPAEMQCLDSNGTAEHKAILKRPGFDIADVSYGKKPLSVTCIHVPKSPDMRNDLEQLKPLPNDNMYTGSKIYGSQEIMANKESLSEAPSHSANTNKSVDGFNLTTERCNAKHPLKRQIDLRNSANVVTTDIPREYSAKMPYNVSLKSALSAVSAEEHLEEDVLVNIPMVSSNVAHYETLHQHIESAANAHSHISLMETICEPNGISKPPLSDFKSLLPFKGINSCSSKERSHSGSPISQNEAPEHNIYDLNHSSMKKHASSELRPANIRTSFTGTTTANSMVDTTHTKSTSFNKPGPGTSDALWIGSIDIDKGTLSLEEVASLSEEKDPNNYGPIIKRSIDKIVTKAKREELDKVQSTKVKLQICCDEIQERTSNQRAGPVLTIKRHKAALPEALVDRAWTDWVDTMDIASVYIPVPTCEKIEIAVDPVLTATDTNIIPDNSPQNIPSPIENTSSVLSFPGSAYVLHGQSGTRHNSGSRSAEKSPKLVDIPSTSVSLTSNACVVQSATVSQSGNAITPIVKHVTPGMKDKDHMHGRSLVSLPSHSPGLDFRSRDSSPNPVCNFSNQIPSASGRQFSLSPKNSTYPPVHTQRLPPKMSTNKIPFESEAVGAIDIAAMEEDAWASKLSDYHLRDNLIRDIDERKAGQTGNTHQAVVHEISEGETFISSKDTLIPLEKAPHIYPDLTRGHRGVADMVNPVRFGTPTKIVVPTMVRETPTHIQVDNILQLQGPITIAGCFRDLVLDIGYASADSQFIHSMVRTSDVYSPIESVECLQQNNYLSGVGDTVRRSRFQTQPDVSQVPAMVTPTPVARVEKIVEFHDIALDSSDSLQVVWERVHCVADTFYPDMRIIMDVNRNSAEAVNATLPYSNDGEEAIGIIPALSGEMESLSVCGHPQFRDTVHATIYMNLEDLSQIAAAVKSKKPKPRDKKVTSLVSSCVIS